MNSSESNNSKRLAQKPRIVATRHCGSRSDGNAASTSPVDALLPNHGCHPPLMPTPMLTIDAYAIILNVCICTYIAVAVKFVVHAPR
jgi:hypothetical protein